MTLPKKYHAAEVEPRLLDFWKEQKIYHYDPHSDWPVFSIDSPPATVSGRLHLGHVYSYTHQDLIARFKRMQGYNVFYPMGFDDNGLPTERLVERELGVCAKEIDRTEFIRLCLETSDAVEKKYQDLWARLGLSVDWRFTYRTIDDRSRQIAQWSFCNLHEKGLVYRDQAPVNWCPVCSTAIAQADIDDKLRRSEFIVLSFRIENGPDFSIATTRPELLPACVAVFVHPDDGRYAAIIGKTAIVPIFNQRVPIISDAQVEPGKGTGAVMCCTFGDGMDVTWWRQYNLPAIELIDEKGHMRSPAGELEGLPVAKARENMIAKLDELGLLLSRNTTEQMVPVHERCDTPVETRITAQWFIKLLEYKERLLDMGEKVNWHPPSMAARYRSWVENLNWDWCISRQRYFGVPFPVWYCQSCSKPIVARLDQLPVDPLRDMPPSPCPQCGSREFLPERAVMDTWATSSLTPQIAARFPLSGKAYPVNGMEADTNYTDLYPFSLRPQAHEIIRTWAFYTIVMSTYHFGELPWSHVLISGWGIAGAGMGKISKSRGGGPLLPAAMIQRYSADAVRYWASSTSPGKDALVDETKMRVGAKLVTKLWNIARFAERVLTDFHPRQHSRELEYTPADRWILTRLNTLIARMTTLLENYEYASAKSIFESFFWTALSDNYLEMAKQRFYGESSPTKLGGQVTLYTCLLNSIKLLAPFLPFVCEEIYQLFFLPLDGHTFSVHLASWPSPEPTWSDPRAEAFGETLVQIATAVRRFKSTHSLPLNTSLDRLILTTRASELQAQLRLATPDLQSISRAELIQIGGEPSSAGEVIFQGDDLSVSVLRSAIPKNSDAQV